MASGITLIFLTIAFIVVANEIPTETNPDSEVESSLPFNLAPFGQFSQSDLESDALECNQVVSCDFNDIPYGMKDEEYNARLKEFRMKLLRAHMLKDEKKSVKLIQNFVISQLRTRDIESGYPRDVSLLNGEIILHDSILQYDLIQLLVYLDERVSTFDKCIYCKRHIGDVTHTTLFNCGHMSHEVCYTASRNTKGEACIECEPKSEQRRSWSFW